MTRTLNFRCSSLLFHFQAPVSNNDGQEDDSEASGSMIFHSFSRLFDIVHKDKTSGILTPFLTPPIEQAEPKKLRNCLNLFSKTFENKFKQFLKDARESGWSQGGGLSLMLEG